MLVDKPILKIESIATDTPLRVLYILGFGRSGSTILDTILGNHPDVKSAGEATHVAHDAWLGGGRCACGQLGSGCAFWNDVGQRWTDRVGRVDVAHFAKITREIETGHFWRRRLFEQAQRQNTCLLDYGRLTDGLLRAIRDTSQKTWIVDSSKGATRALALAMIPGVQLRVVHLVRDCRGVAWSCKKHLKKDEKGGVCRDDPGRKVWRTAMVWNVGNMRSSWVRRHLPKEHSIRVRYEDFVSDPKGEIQRIGRLIDLDLGELAQRVTSGGVMSVGHTMAGNRLRMSGNVRLRPDVEWVDKLSVRDRLTCWAISGWLSRRYGYQLRPACVDQPGLRRAA